MNAPEYAAMKAVANTSLAKHPKDSDLVVITSARFNSLTGEKMQQQTETVSIVRLKEEIASAEAQLQMKKDMLKDLELA